jgi:uncharacterized protein (TIGR03000 family)
LVTPPLQPGREYHYTLTAELERDGKPIKVTRRVAVRAGAETRVEFVLPQAVSRRE